MTMRRSALPVFLQTGGIMLALGALALAPPATGRMLLVPLGAQDTAALLPRALDAGSLLLGPGPLPHSYVVIGDGARLSAALSGLAILRTAAPPAGCDDAGV